MKRITSLAAALLGVVLAGNALAQQFPTKPVRIVVSYPPGGPVDVLARPLAEGLQKAWGGNPVIVENKPGANAIIGTDYVAKQPADGHTLLLANDPSLSSNQYLFSKLPYDPVKDLVPVATIATTTLILLVPASLPANNLRELIAMAKKDPGKLTYGSIGPGSVTHLDAEAFASAAGIKLTHVPYKGTGEVVPALLAGQIDMALSAIGPSLPHIRSGKMKALAVAQPQRSALVPEVPTFAEGGVPFEAKSWFAIAVPAGTPRPVIDRIAADVKRVVEQPEYREKYITGMGLDAFSLGPDEFAAFLAKDREKYAQRVKLANVRLD
ncbi:MAG TPA: tripartite tricarboxylate transporter substrate binding protein [Burkholderiales bacterium]|nr:tripartite tricarboxylate transporter substrate binding protein [Burkholderiales bacterium]